jgi:hypothetical protein
MMATETRSENTRAIETKTAHEEPLADRVLSLAAMGGAVCGAVAGAALGAEIGTAFPIMCGALGTMLGSGLTAGGWCLLVGLWTGLSAGKHVRHRFDPVAEPQPVAPAAGTV